MSEAREIAGKRLLIVDDEPIALKNLAHALRKERYAVDTAASGQVALRALEDSRYEVVLTDLRMEKVDGMQILRHCKTHHPETEVIMITGHATVSSAVDAMKAGAFHYIEKPFRLDEVRHVVREAITLVLLKRENDALRALVKGQSPGAHIVTQDAGMQKLLETARRVAATEANVLLTGESGTGKELLARFLHAHSPRSTQPFVAVNCGAFSEELLANELFGHEKGAYTGATERRIGLIESAHGGTLFLDEVTEMSPAMQAKLLRVVQERELLRLGGTRPVRVDVRLLAASNRDLKEAVAEGRFRQDLYFRLNVVNLHLPPLAERREDIPLLAWHFLNKHATLMKRPIQDIHPDAMAMLRAYDYPGNVRELENIIERAVAMAGGTVLEPVHLPASLRRLRVKTLRKPDEALPTLEAQEAEYIRWVLEQTGGNRTRAAEILGIDRVSLWRKVRRYGLA
jgi:DNA-binding NtrC family response regulator